MTHLKNNSNNEVPGYIRNSLIHIIEYDEIMLSEYGLTLAKAFKQIQDRRAEELKKQAEELDKALS